MASLQDVINKQDPSWVSKVLESNNVQWLNKLLVSEENEERKAVIRARIENINPLVIYQWER